MNRAIALPLIFWTGAAGALTPSQWHYRQSIDVPAPGLVQVQLPPETLNIVALLILISRLLPKV
jgi:hypothetical protein